MKKFITIWLPVFLWAFLIFTFSSLPTVEASEIYWQDFVVKKLAHLIEYAVLGFLIFRALISVGFSKTDASFYTVLLCVLYAFSDEFHQSFTRGRGPTIRDIVLDTVGASTAVFGIWKFGHLPLLNKVLKYRPQ